MGKFTIGLVLPNPGPVPTRNCRDMPLESVASETASTTSATDSHALFSPSLAVNVLDPLYVLNHFAFDSAGNRSLLGVASLVDRRLVPVDPGLLLPWESLIQFQSEFQPIDPRLAQDS